MRLENKIRLRRIKRNLRYYIEDNAPFAIGAGLVVYFVDGYSFTMSLIRYYFNM